MLFVREMQEDYVMKFIKERELGDSLNNSLYNVQGGRNRKTLNKCFILFFCVGIFCLIGCKRESTEVKEAKSSRPHCVIYLQPYDDFTVKEAEALKPVLEKNFNKFLDGDWKFKVKSPISLPSELYVKKSNRYRALGILKDLKKLSPKENEVFIGLSHKDICADVHGYKDFGIIGLSYCPGKVCIVSDKRLKNKSVMWKPILHEFIHAFYGVLHCPNDDPQCIMADARYRGSFKTQVKLCDACNSRITQNKRHITK